ncbi:putative chromatin regulator PHD family [Helianthus annuus]|uniref:Chromatin regulator PHD family n=1 Tax=Helianthus annuus TaxID=4232 RepID=A0A251ULR6_HELAN|nr:uncharacterized protein LOC118492500 [Helianthus annuus]KAF5804272.1 putative chromatin regulator PHD family [Helianthus annuus]
MEFKEVQPEEIIQHEHPLILEDLQLMFQNYLEDDDDIDDQDLINMQKFECKCDVCGYRIDWYHRYYYKCSQSSSCSYSLHKSCRELSTTLRFPAHPIHTLRLKKSSNSWSCHSCLTKHVDGICYHCSTCDYEIDLRCATFAKQTMIHHPGHSHPLTSITLDPSLSKCYACGKEHKGVFYHCNTCFYFSIHVDCVALPFKLSSKHHVHKLTLSYSFTVIPYHSKCRICVTSISERDWLYKCGKCRYYVHLDCALSRGEPFMSIFSHGTGKSDTSSKAADYPNLLHYPLSDESNNILPYHLRSGDYRHFDQIKSDNMHPSHDHPLLLINAPDTLHDPMRRIKLLCDGCVRPITTMPFYGCNQGCNFSLHEWCTRLPSELENHPGHTLALFNSPSELAYTGFSCSICGLLCNGFGYFCSRPHCMYRVDVHCGFIPERIMHEAHPNHLLSRVKASSIQSTSSTLACHACGITINGGEFCFRCGFCDFYLDNRCALHLPKTIKNRYDKHPLKLSYSPIENHKSEYFCEVCEEELIPENWFYHCQECSQSIHSACAPLILQSEQGFNDSRNDRTGVYKLINMKFGHLVTFDSHPHPMLLVMGTKSDIGLCEVCVGERQSLLIFQCSICKLVFHVSCGPKNPHGQFLDHFGRLLARFFLSRIKPKEKLEHHETAAVTFYPTEVMRPVTGHWKTADEQP